MLNTNMNMNVNTRYPWFRIYIFSRLALVKTQDLFYHCFCCYKVINKDFVANVSCNQCGDGRDVCWGYVR